MLCFDVGDLRHIGMLLKKSSTEIEIQDHKKKGPSQTIPENIV